MIAPYSTWVDYVMERTSSTKMSFVCKSKYEIAFPSLIKRLIVPETFVGYKDLFEFIRKNCSKNLVSLLVTVYVLSDDVDERIYIELVKDQLKHLKYLRVNNDSHGKLDEQLLQYTEHLKVLNIINYCRKGCTRNTKCNGFTYGG